MQAKLVSVTAPFVPGIVNAEDLIVYCARVSNPQNQLNCETGGRLLKYCLEHRHWSVFEMADMTIEVETSRAIAAQILRHRSFVFQEFSQRYAKANLGFEAIRMRRADDHNRQNSIDDLPADLRSFFEAMAVKQQESAKELYLEMVEAGIAPECARFVLPLNTTSRLYMKGCVRSWIHYLQARLAAETQQEHRELAELVRPIFAAQFPRVAACLGM